MKQLPDTLRNEEGSVLLLTLVLLILLTIAGLGILSTTDTELQITRNDKCFKQNITRAESAVMEAAQLLAYFDSQGQKAELKPETSSQEWLNDAPVAPDAWAASNSTRSEIYDSLSGYTATYEGIAPGASLDLASSSTMRQYELVGRSEQCQGLLDIIAGYRIRF
jgi:Tfp pilus assembly protein PilX